MRKSKAIKSFYYWGNRIYSPLGKIDKKAELMRLGWAKAIDTGIYKKLPSDPI